VRTKFSGHCEIDDDDEDDDNNNGNADTKAVPLLSPGGSGLCGGNVEVLVCLNHIRLRFFGLFLDVHDHGLLLHDNCVQILEQLCQLSHCTLDLLDSIVALANICQCALGLATAVRVKECLLEDLGIGAGLGGLDDFLLGGIRVDDEVLTTLLLLDFLAELRLYGLVVVDCFANTAVQGIDLSFVARVSGLGA